MLFVSAFEKASKPDRTSLQPHPSPTKNRHAPQQTGHRSNNCATQSRSTLFVSNQQVFRVARKCVPMLGALPLLPPASSSDTPRRHKPHRRAPARTSKPRWCEQHQHQHQHQNQQSFRRSPCECVTLCLLTTAGLVGSRKLLSSNSSFVRMDFETAERTTGS